MANALLAVGGAGSFGFFFDVERLLHFAREHHFVGLAGKPVHAGEYSGFFGLVAEAIDLATQSFAILYPGNGNPRGQRQRIGQFESLDRRVLIAHVARIPHVASPIICQSEKGWHVGVVGIVASRLVQRYRRPSLVIAFGNDGPGRGSGRSIDGFDLLQALQTCADLFVTYGGHAMAAGFAIERPQVAALHQRFNEACSHSLKDRDLRATITIEAWLDSTDADMRFCEALEQLKPFGAGYPRPIWGLRSLRVVGKPRVVGTRHLKLRLASGGTEWDAIAFGMADRKLPDGPIDVACAVEKNSFRGRDSVQLNIQDFRPAE